MPGKERRPSDDEKALWREMTGDVRPLAKRGDTEAAPPPAPQQS